MSSIDVRSNVERGEVHGVIDLDVPPARVYRALTDPDELPLWWGSDDTYRTYDYKIDLRPGGAWSCLARSAEGGDVATVRGTYITVDPPRLLEMSWEPSWENFASTRVRYDLVPLAGGTRMTILHTGFTAPVACEDHADGWRRVTGWLTQYLETHESAASPR